MFSRDVLYRPRTSAGVDGQTERRGTSIPGSRFDLVAGVGGAVRVPDTMMDNPRLRLLVGTHGRTLVVVLAVIGLFSLAGAGATYLNPPTETVTEDVHEHEVTTTTATSAVVQEDNELWPEGTELENSPVYLMNATPAMTVTAGTNVDGADHAVVSHEWVLTIEARHDEDEFWSESETLATETHEGTEATTTATVDAEAIHDRVTRVEEVVGPAGTVSVELTLIIEYASDPGADHGYEGTETLSTDLVIDEKSYTFAEDLEDETTRSDEAEMQVTQPRNWTWITVLGLFGLISLFAAAGLYAQRPESIDLDEARNDLHRRQYAQWISSGTIPMGINQQFIELDSLEDVVDVAIDTEQRVVYDERRNLYAVIDEHVAYYFSPDGTWMATAFPGLDTSEPPSGVPPGGPPEPPGGPPEPPGDPPEPTGGPPEPTGGPPEPTGDPPDPTGSSGDGPRGGPPDSLVDEPPDATPSEDGQDTDADAAEEFDDRVFEWGLDSEDDSETE